MERRIVWMSEDEDYESYETYFLGTFSGHLDASDGTDDEFHGLSIDDALAWARERADQVYLRFDNSGYYSAGIRNDNDYPSWPPGGLPRWERRRPRGEEWKDRGEDEAPIGWVVTVSLDPTSGELPTERAGWDETAAAIAARAGAAPPEAWGVDDFIAAANAGRERSIGWTAYVPVYTIELEVDASTREAAVASAIERCEPLPEGWHASGEAAPKR